MEETRILTLHLLAPLVGESLIPGLSWSDAIPTMGSLFWTFTVDQILLDNKENGPSLVKPLRQPNTLPSLAPGSYFLSQWKEGSSKTIDDGIEDFLRQLWWEGKACKGPLVLRVLNEGGRRTFQAIRALA
jgi:hypothetical protein